MFEVGVKSEKLAKVAPITAAQAEPISVPHCGVEQPPRAVGAAQLSASGDLQLRRDL
jgi:hypothetical protein